MTLRSLAAVLVAALAALSLHAQGEPRFEPTAEQRRRPPLMPWQRNLEDALALQRASGKPLLICVNMDGELACERLAWGRYRDPAFARLASGFVCLVASPDRRQPLDYDDRGRRLPDLKLGRVIPAEHIGIEPVLFERYFNGRRVAPRHVGVAPDGKILFDIFLTRGLRPIDEALAKHGVKGRVRPLRKGKDGKPTDKALLSSPDAEHRDQLETRFVAAQESHRAALARVAFSADRRVQHPELARLALRDPAPVVRKVAVGNCAAHIASVPVGLLGSVVEACGHDRASMNLAADAFHRLAQESVDETTRQRATFLARVTAGQAVRSGIVDVDRWRGAVAEIASIAVWTPSEEQIDALEDRLSTLEASLRSKPDDAALNLEIAATNLRYARVRLLQRQDPTLLLEDARAAARRAIAAGDDGRGYAYLAWTSHLLGDVEGATAAAVRALPLLVESEPASELAVETLAVLAHARTAALYAAMKAGAAWPASWIADTRAAYDALMGHPGCREEHVTAYLTWLDAIEARNLMADVARDGVLRFSASGKLHEELRRVVLRDRGASALSQAYDDLLATQRTPMTLWYAGLGRLVAAEHHVKTRQPDTALADYVASVRDFRASMAGAAEYADSANHYICLAESGRARLLLNRGEAEAAAEAVLAGLAARPASASDKDGLGVTPRATAKQVVQALRDAGAAAAADGLTKALDGLGVTLF